MEKISLTVEQWVALQEQSPDGAGQIPVWFQVTGCSMLPFVRPFRDQVMIVAVKEETLKVGDIVLFPGKYKGGDHCPRADLWRRQPASRRLATQGATIRQGAAHQAWAAHHRLRIVPMAESVPALELAAAPASCAIAAVPSDEQTAPPIPTNLLAHARILFCRLSPAGG